MGSRAVIILCRDEDIARKRFGVTTGDGICYTRTGRRFFEDEEMQRKVLSRVRGAMDHSGLWEELNAEWICLDGELMPWSLKAQDLLRTQYAAIGAAARAALPEAERLLETAIARGVESPPDVGTGSGAPSGSSAPALTLPKMLAKQHERRESAALYTDAYRRYCWPVNSIEDIRFAPFHILATEGHVHTDRDHGWHMNTLSRLCGTGDSLLYATPYQVVDVTDPEAQEAAVHWWEELTARGGEGMVVKPLTFTAKSRTGLVQPGVKCRGREYLRIIYGPEYTMPENLERLRTRGLGLKRSLALREFALGLEALERFVRKEPLHRVHECVFGVLALESEPVDPRL